MKGKKVKEMTTLSPVSLRPFCPQDMDALAEIVTNTQVNKTYMLPDFPSRQDALPLCRRLEALSNDETHFVRAICAEGCVVGFLNDVEQTGGCVEVGYVVHPAHWNKGYATLALKEATRQLFERGFTAVEAGYFEENTASARVMEKAGMLPISKTDTISYRGQDHLCRYFRITR